MCTTRATYDDAGNLAMVLPPTASGPSDNRRILYAYSDDNLVASMESPSPLADGERVTTSAQYDADGRPIKSTDALGKANTRAYTADGLVKTRTGYPHGALTHVSSAAYNANGSQTRYTNEVGNAETATYYADDRLKDSSDAAANKTSYVYDGVGNPTEVRSPSANALEVTNPSGTPTRYTYTSDDLVASAVVPIKPDATASIRRRTTYGYDPAGRKATEHVEEVDAAGTPIAGRDGGTLAFTYMANDRLASETGRENNETITHHYDPAGAQTSITQSGGPTVASAFYLDGLERRVDDGDGHTTTAAYDGAGAVVARQLIGPGPAVQKTTIANNHAGLASSMTTDGGVGTFSFAYDKIGRPTTETQPSGAAMASAWNPDDTLLSQALTRSGGTVNIATWGYTWDAAYRRLTQSFSGTDQAGAPIAAVSFAYAYNTAKRLSQVTFGATPKPITYDRDGNRTSFEGITWTYNSDDSVKTQAASTPSIYNYLYAYEPFGGLKSDLCSTMAYDGFDRLESSAEGTGGGCNNPGTASFTYDGLDRRRSANDGATTGLHYAGQGSALVAETEAGADLRYVLDEASVPRATEAAGAVEHLSGDGDGSVATITSSSGGVACAVRYDPFGEGRVASGAALVAGANRPCFAASATEQPRSSVFFQGANRDATTGQDQLGSRTYDPSKASFLTPDTYRTGGSAQNLSVGVDPLTRNTYGYVNGDPVNFVDPDGHWGRWRRAPTLEQRYARSRDAIGRELGRVRSERAAVLDDLEATFGPDGAHSPALRQFDRRIAALSALAKPGRQIYSFDPSGDDAKIVEVIGDLRTASNVAVVLDGTGQGLLNFDSGVGAKARRIRDQAGTDNTATVAYLGYDTPNSAGLGGNRGPATAAGVGLVGFVGGVRGLNATAHISVVGHSYGSIVVGEAMSRGLAADEVVLTGSPGINANSIAGTGFGGRVWVAHAAGDNWVGKHVLWGNPHGPDPYNFADVFRLRTDGSSGHNEYYQGRSLRGIGAVVAGRARRSGSGGGWGS